MKLEKNTSSQKKIPFLFDYIAKKKDEDVEHLTARGIAKELGFKSATSVTTILFNIIQKPGRKNYGYNTVFLFNEFSKIMKLDKPRKVYIVGPQYPFIDKEKMEKRNLILCGVSSEFNSKEIIKKHISVLIITQEVPFEELKKLEGKVTAILNFSSKIYEDIAIPIYNFDIMEILLNMWFQLVEEEKIK